MNNKGCKYRVFTFRAIDSPKLCEEYINGHVKILTDFGIENITSNNNSWTLNPDVYCLGLISENNELLGGIRIQLANGIDPLPIEYAIGSMENKIYNLVNQYRLNGGVGELSGLWVNNKLKGLGIGVYLVRAAIASSNQLNFKTLIGICGDVTLTMFRNVGFGVDTSIGKHGTFYYPNSLLIAYAVGILDTVTLHKSTSYDKDIMLSLRDNLRIKRVEKDRGVDVKIDYNLEYTNVSDINYRNNNEDKFN